MATVVPFRGWRVTAEQAARVLSVPYDVVNRDEAKALAAKNPVSFLHVTKPEIDFEAEVEATAEPVYARGAMALFQMIQKGILVQEEVPCYYAYALTMGSHRQVGVILGASLAEYINNKVRRHEFTRPDKEQDRVRHMEAVGAQTGKVFLLHRPHAGIAQVLERVTSEPALVDVATPDGVRHQLWSVSDAAQQKAITEGFDEVGPLYIADGHHRAAAAMRVAVARRAMGKARYDSISERLLAVSFPCDQVQILPYHRVVKDLGDNTPEQFLAALQEHFDVAEGKPPAKRGCFGLFMGGKWRTLTAKASTRGMDMVSNLDVSILQNFVLNLLCKIEDVRRDPRIDFVGGIRGDAELEKRVGEGWAAAFRLHPTDMNDLLKVADSGASMPPKSTWFEPKLRDGLVTLRFDPS